MLQQLKTLRVLTEQEKKTITELEKQYKAFLSSIMETETTLTCDRQEIEKAKCSLQDALISTVRSIVLSLRV